MLIRSQGKQDLINLSLVKVLNIEREQKTNTINAYFSSDNKFICLGSYSTNEKALSVLDMIQDRYDDLEFNRRCFEGYLSIVFEMPEDSDI